MIQYIKGDYMNIYKCLNDITKYIDEHLEEKIDYNKLAMFMGVNSYTMQRIFSMLCGITIGEYIRKRKLSNAGVDLYENNPKIIDLALKYNYENATSFSRAFENFHGIKPSLVNKETKLKIFPRIIFDENIKITDEISYEIIELPEMNLYGVSTPSSTATIKYDAPKFFQETYHKYKKQYGDIDYGMICYDNEREEVKQYYCLYKKEIPEFEKIKIPASKWLKFRINSQEPQDIRATSQKFYTQIFPSSPYNLKEIPELEYYHDDVTDFLIAIN